MNMQKSPKFGSKAATRNLSTAEANVSEILEFDNESIKPEGEYKLIAINEIYSVKQVRTLFEESKIKALSKSMISEGQIQPIVVSPLDSKGYRIQKGECRWRAAKISDGKITHLECIVRKDGTLLQQFSENFVRNELTPFDTGNGFIMIKDEENWSNKELAEHFNLSESVVSAYIKCVDAPEFVADAFLKGKINDVDTINVLRIAAGIDKEKTKAFLDSEESFTRKQAQEFNKSLKAKAKAKNEKPTSNNTSNVLPDTQETIKDKPTQEDAPETQSTINQDASEQETILETASSTTNELNPKSSPVATSQLEPVSKSDSLNRIRVSVEGDFGVIDTLAECEDGCVVVILDNSAGKLTLPVSDVVLVGYAQN